MEGEHGAGGDGELAAAFGALESAPAERVAIENTAVRTDRLALGLGPTELAEDREGFLLVNPDELVDREVPAFWRQEEVLPLLVFHTSVPRQRNRRRRNATGPEVPGSSGSGEACG